MSTRLLSHAPAPRDHAPAAPPTGQASDARHSWRDLPAAQQPEWPDPEALRDVIAELESYPPLVFAGECDQLRA
ncbi:3-deoxy-7-phosphoheptulonate synthase, partial [Streptomyces chitinivorans]|uniref:3-deoxy-7-phosphoheptulonate synthase n=1 Tax=Streptomyces chitinivorans TaxID=1257027 RepID=UPI003CD05B51